jgi:hypothetical protein
MGDSRPVNRENPYIEPETVGGVTPRRPPRYSAAGVALLALLAVLLAGIAFSQGHFRSMFEDFDVSLPAVSNAALSPILPSGLGLVLFASVVVEIAGGRRQAAKWWQGFAAMIGLATLAIYLVGALWPFVSLVQSLS